MTAAAVARPPPIAPAAAARASLAPASSTDIEDAADDAADDAAEAPTGSLARRSGSSGSGRPRLARAAFLDRPAETREVQGRPESGRPASDGNALFGRVLFTAGTGSSFRAQGSGRDLSALAARMSIRLSDDGAAAHAPPSLEVIRSGFLSSDSDSLLDPRDLRLLAVLGTGAFGVVYKAKWTPAARPAGVATAAAADADARVASLVASGDGLVAVKRLKLAVAPDRTGETPRAQGETPRGMAAAAAAKVDAEHNGALPALFARELSDFCNELLMLRAIHHAHVIGYIGCTLHADENGDDQLSIITELATHGTLKPLICSTSGLFRPFTTADGLRWAHQIGAGMAYLHACTPAIVHRDLKPENVLLCGDRATAKIGDFGLGTFEHKGRRMSNVKLTGQVGSVRYMAPENYRQEAYGTANDVYSYAILLFELLTRGRAYDGLYIPVDDIGRRAALPDTPLRPALPAVWPLEAKRLVALAWHAQPGERPDFGAITAELGNWRFDPSKRVLRQVARGSSRGLLEIGGFRSAMLKTDYADTRSKGRWRKAASGARVPGAHVPVDAGTALGAVSPNPPTYWACAPAPALRGKAKAPAGAVDGPPVASFFV
ncbi:hypothetical protein KFE25_013219 [Diacronema lutheri]|uniref:Protein kinase domain-containing protein n=1 Tax=Diacronema lutheri TaxID=2081491 RepID=A0A8J5X228_DIALT|nr:hypothetical protein KFE25_013219 [Diacronema lutheri]